MNDAGSLGGGLLAIFAIVLVIIAYMSLFTVYQTQQALVVRLGDPIRIITEPGLNMKLPVIDTVIYVDNRIKDLENGAQEVIASDQKRLVRRPGAAASHIRPSAATLFTLSWNRLSRRSRAARISRTSHGAPQFLSAAVAPARSGARSAGYRLRDRSPA
jgi:regulator of protease activity HflC (stomatin/prohibitin superfamily)